MNMEKLGALLFAAWLPLVALAEGGSAACKADAQKFCSSAGGSMLDCLLDHQQEISDACYGALKEKLQDQKSNAPAGGGGTQACRQDAETFCRGVQPGGGRIVDCLIEHQKEISDGCYQLLKRKISSGDPEVEPGGASGYSAVPTVYKARTSDGRIVYGDTVPLNATSMHPVENRVNVSLPFR